MVRMITGFKGGLDEDILPGIINGQRLEQFPQQEMETTYEHMKILSLFLSKIAHKRTI